MCIEWHTTGRPALARVYGISTHDRNFPIATNRRFMDARGNGREPLYARPPIGLEPRWRISNLDIIIIATTEPWTKLSIFRLLRNRAKEIRKRFLSRRCSIIQTKKNKETIERIGSNQGLNASLPIVYRRRVTPRSFIREWRSDKLAIGGQRTEKYILRETGDYRTTMARGKDYGLRPQSHSDSALRRCAWPLIQKWK